MSSQKCECKKCGYQVPKALRKLQEDGVIGEPYCDLKDLLNDYFRKPEEECNITLEDTLENIFRKVGNSEIVKSFRNYVLEDHDTKYENGHCIYCRDTVLSKLCLVCRKDAGNNECGSCRKCYHFLYRKLGNDFLDAMRKTYKNIIEHNH